MIIDLYWFYFADTFDIRDCRILLLNFLRTSEKMIMQIEIKLYK